MASFQIEINDDALQAAFAELKRRGTNTRPLMAEIGAELLRTTRENFDGQHDPDGAAWTPLSAAYLRYKKGERKDKTKRDKNQRPRPATLKVLQWSRDLRDSITMQVGDNDLIVGTNVIYARVHQLGGGSRNMPARPFLGVSDDNKNFITEAARDFIEGALSGD
jgi:phage virion morphogenesis protein